MPPPTTTDWVRFHALHRPAAVALIDAGRDITYREFYRDAAKMTGALGALSPPRGRVAAIECGSLYLHWLVLLACESLGVVTGSFLPKHRHAQPLLAHADLALCEHEIPFPWRGRAHLLTPDWVSDALAGDAADVELGCVPIELADPQRIRRSSGTTGAAKMMVASRAAEEAGLRSFMAHMGFSKETRFLIASPFSVASMYQRATACLRLGATCIFDARLSLAQAVVAYRPTHVRLFQHQVTPLLDELPAAFQKPKRLTVMLGAGPVSADMRTRIMTRLATEIVYTYNTNETLMIAVVGEDGVGTLRAGAEVRVVDEHDRPLPVGQAGRLMVKTDSMVEGYLEEPEATARLFSGGWFATSDAGMLVGERRIKIIGRMDDVLNLGGEKFSPADFEDLVARHAGVKEAGATSVLGPLGVEDLCLAVVPKPDASMASIVEFISANIRIQGVRLRWMEVEHLPRTETGKLRRHVLKTMFEKVG